jgi:hypothetical protein
VHIRAEYNSEVRPSQSALSTSVSQPCTRASTMSRDKSRERASSPLVLTGKHDLVPSLARGQGKADDERSRRGLRRRRTGLARRSRRRRRRRAVRVEGDEGLAFSAAGPLHPASLLAGAVGRRGEARRSGIRPSSVVLRGVAADERGEGEDEGGAGLPAQATGGRRRVVADSASHGVSH